MPHALSETGTTLDDKYILLGEVESNELYSLYRAEHLRLGLRVTIQLGRGRDGASAVLDAARKAALVEHENVWRVLDSGIAPSGAPYVALAGLEGESLAAHVKRSGALDEAEALEITKQVLAGLDACHDSELLHGHLSPHTVWITVSEAGHTSAKLFGFGLPSGSPSARHWLAPEVNQQRFDERADLYSSAGILLTLLGGDPGPPAPSLPSGLRPALAALVTWGLAIGKKQRPSSARQFLEALDGISEQPEQEIEEPPQSSAVVRVARPRRRPLAARGVSDSLLLSPRIPPAAPAPLFDSRDATFSTSEQAEKSRELSASDTRKRTLQATLTGIAIGVLVAWLSGLL